MSALPGVVDAHVHLGPPKYAAAEQFTEAMNTEGIVAAVLVQHLGNVDNDYLAGVRDARPECFAAIAIVEQELDLDRVLAAGFAGLRIAPGRSAVFDALERRSAVASITGPIQDVASPQFRAIVRSHPNVRFRVEHVGGFRYGHSAEDRNQFSALLALAEEPNVTLMWSGFFLNAGTPFPYANTHGYLAETLHAFGSERIMWSGDWNRADLAPQDYRQAIEVVGLVAEDDKQVGDILARTACRVFGMTAPRCEKETHV